MTDASDDRTVPGAAVVDPVGPDVAGPGGIPEPPWRPATKAAPPRIPITRESIIEAALRVLDRHGMDGLSMRKVGEELGAGAASLYWHVRNKDELLQLLFERVTGEVALPPPEPDRWMDQVKELARQIRDVMSRHRDIARISLGRIPSGPAIATVAEWTFDLLQPAGLPDHVIAFAGDLLSLYVGAYAFEESLGLASPTGEDLPPEQIVAMIRDYLRSLPADRFPHTVAAVDLLMGGPPDARFEFGLDVIVRGLASFVADAAEGAAGPSGPGVPSGGEVAAEEVAGEDRRTAARIETQRLVLEPVTVETARAVIAGDLSGLVAGEGWPHQDTADAMATATEAGAAPGWLITVGGRVIGDCGAFAWPNQSGQVEIGYGLAPPFRGLGFATEAVGAMCAWLFAEAGAVVITAGVVATNGASQRVLSKLGFTITNGDDDNIAYALRRTDPGPLR